MVCYTALLWQQIADTSSLLCQCVAVSASVKGWWDHWFHWLHGAVMRHKCQNWSVLATGSYNLKAYFSLPSWKLPSSSFLWKEGCRGHLFSITPHSSDRISMFLGEQDLCHAQSLYSGWSFSTHPWVPLANDPDLANQYISSPLPQIGSGMVTWQVKPVRFTFKNTECKVSLSTEITERIELKSRGTRGYRVEKASLKIANREENRAQRWEGTVVMTVRTPRSSQTWSYTSFDFLIMWISYTLF